jgi:hypothetical protein
MGPRPPLPRPDLPRALREFGGPRSPLKRWLWNLRAGRMQKTLSATAALSGLPLGFEMYLEH